MNKCGPEIQSSECDSDSCEEPRDGRKNRVTPGQNAIMIKIGVTEGQLNSLIMKRNSGFAEEGDDQEIDKLIQVLESERQKLRAMQLTAARQRKYRQRQRQKLERIAANNPAALGLLHAKPGRPRKDQSQSADSSAPRGGWSWGDFAKVPGCTSGSTAGSTGEPEVPEQ